MKVNEMGWASGTWRVAGGGRKCIKIVKNLKEKTILKV
jgi:hypothetical protein